jgi:TRAP-type C4-dicarboxylate transport system permease small subunit
MTPEIHTQVTAEELAQTFEESGHAPVDLSDYAFEDWLALGLFWAMCLAVFLQFFTRYVLNDSFAWTEEIATNCNVALVFVGSAMCVRLSRHIQVDFLYRYLPPRAGACSPRGSTSCASPSSPTGPFLSGASWHRGGRADDHDLPLPKNLFYALRLLGFVLMFFRSSRSPSPTGGAAIPCSNGPRRSTHRSWLKPDAHPDRLLSRLMIIGVPVAISMAVASLLYILVTGMVPDVIVAQRMIAGVESFPLLAVPFFILAGNLMNIAGVTGRIYAFAVALVGWMKGGLAQVNIIGSVIFSGMSARPSPTPPASAPSRSRP